ncbi:MAG: hypothetical protein LBU41_01575, partial [Clostridiales Family XIII bacterium]|nr:hypothetical protein [Clostridiales Family XIII bacterium]
MHKNLKIAILVLLDIFLFNLSYFLAYLLRFEFDVSSSGFQTYFPAYVDNLIFLLLFKVLVFFFMGMYNSLWQYASANDLLKVVRAAFFSSLLSIAFLILIQQHPAMPRSIYVLSFMFD